MSADGSDQPIDALDHHDLAREVRKLRQEVEQLRANYESQQVELEQLRGDLQRERRERKDAEEELRKERTQQIANAKLSIHDDIEDLHDTVVDEQQMRSRADAQLKHRVNEVAEAADVEVTDADLIEKDRLVRLVRNGPEDVTDRIYPVHERARALLQHANDWGRVVSDANGYRVVYTAPEVRPFLNAYFDRTFKSSEIKRVFEKIRGLAETSPRTVRKDKTRKGEHLLVVELTEDGHILAAD
ncbi:hypothetical protein [Halorussus caseinilyticus]|uniref:Uncharacterized protein n=1 Tax=Halorussus caseinilyticus TaxID=3034025 RepID=A0ABD5WMJ4_9EURY|nr:hypothetical protein [Halorussus sp. DT72]